MAKKKFNEFPVAASIQDSDIFLLDNASGTGTKKTAAQLLAEYVRGTIPATDTTLSQGGRAADAKVTGHNFDENTRIVYEPEPAEESSTSNDVVWAWSNGVLTYSGTTSSGSDYVYRAKGAFPDGIEPGGTYRVEYETTDPLVAVKIDLYTSGSNSEKYSSSFRKSGLLTVPLDAAQIKIAERIGGASTVSVNGSVGKFRILKLRDEPEIGEIVKKSDEHGVYEIALDWNQGYSGTYPSKPLLIRAPADYGSFITASPVRIPESGVYIYSDDVRKINVHFWKRDANHAFTAATDYANYYAHVNTQEYANTTARYYPYAEGVYFTVRVEGTSIAVSDIRDNVHAFGGSVADYGGRLPNLCSCGIIYDSRELRFYQGKDGINRRQSAYISYVRLQDASKIVFAPPYSGVARIYKINDDDREITVEDEIYAPDNVSNNRTDVYGKSVIDLSAYDFRGFAVIGVMTEPQETEAYLDDIWKTSISHKSNGFLAKYEDAMRHVFVEWKPNVLVTIDGGIPAAAKSNIDTIQRCVFAPDMKASLSDGGYGSWSVNTTMPFTAKGEVHGWWYAGGSEYNVPHMHVTPKSYITASKNNHSRVYVAACRNATGDGRSNNLYGNTCSGMAGVVAGLPTGLAVPALTNHWFTGMTYRDYDGVDDLRPGDFICGDGEKNTDPMIPGTGHVSFVTEVVSINGETFCVNEFESTPPWPGFGTYINLEAFDGYTVENPTGEDRILEWFSSRYMEGKVHGEHQVFQIARLPVKDYKTIRNAYGPYDEDDYAVTSIMCDRGTDAVYCIGEVMTLTVTDGTTEITLYKDGSSVGTVDLTQYPSATYTDGKVYDVTGMIQTAGYYEIYAGSPAAKKESFFVPEDREITVTRDSFSDPDPKVRAAFTPNEEGDEVVAILVYYYAGSGEPDQLRYQVPYLDFDADTVENGYAHFDAPLRVRDYSGVSRGASVVKILRRTPYGTYHVDGTYVSNESTVVLQRAGNAMAV